jgi:hypothetical protein
MADASESYRSTVMSLRSISRLTRGGLPTPRFTEDGVPEHRPSFTALELSKWPKNTFTALGLFDEYRSWRKNDAEINLLRLGCLLPFVLFKAMRSAMRGTTEPREYMGLLVACAYVFKYAMNLYAERQRLRARVVPLAPPPVHEPAWPNAFIMLAHLALVGSELHYAELAMRRVMRASGDAAGAGFGRAALVRMISCEALLPCVLQVAVMSQTLYMLHGAWLAAALLALGYHLQLLARAGGAPADAIALAAAAYGAALWLGSSVEHRARAFFLLARRQERAAKSARRRATAHHRRALLELQAAAGMGRLYHVLKARARRSFFRALRGSKKRSETIQAVEVGCGDNTLTLSTQSARGPRCRCPE